MIEPRPCAAHHKTGDQMDITTVTAAIAGLKNAIDLAKTAMEARDAAKLSEAKSAMLERLIEIQSQCFDLQ